MNWDWLVVVACLCPAACLCVVNYLSVAAVLAICDWLGVASSLVVQVLAIFLINYWYGRPTVLHCYLTGLCVVGVGLSYLCLAAVLAIFARLGVAYSFVVLVLAICLITYHSEYYLKLYYRPTSSFKVPGPAVYPFLGSPSYVFGVLQGYRWWLDNDGDENSSMDLDLRNLHSNKESYFLSCFTRYGPVFRYGYGSVVTVLVGHPDDIKAVFQCKESKLKLRKERETAPLQYNFTMKFSLVSEEHSDLVRSNLAKSVSTHHNGGWAKAAITAELEQLAEELSSRDGGSCRPIGDKLCRTALFSLACRIVLDEAYSYTDEKLKEIIKLFTTHSDCHRGVTPVLNSHGLRTFHEFSVTQRILKMWPSCDLWNWVSYTETFEALTVWFEQTARDWMKNEGANGDRRCTMADLIKDKDEGRLSSILSNEKDVGCAALLHMENITNAAVPQLEWLLHFAREHQGWQAKMRKEIQSLEERQPTAATLPTMYAFIEEVLRLHSVSNGGAHLLVTEPIQIRDYIIPAGVYVKSYFRKTAYDGDKFPNPMEFKPDRFISLEGRFTKNSDLFPFGAGPRRCVGEKFATELMHQFLIAIIGQFLILPAVGGDAAHGYQGNQFRTPPDLPYQFIPVDRQ